MLAAEYNRTKLFCKGHAEIDLEQAICARLAIDAPACSWRIESRPGVGRFLVAARDLAANETVFSELPLVVAAPAADSKEQVLRSEIVAVATQLLCEPPGSPARLLQEPDFSSDEDGALAGSFRAWTLDVLRALQLRPQPLVRADGTAVTLSEGMLRWALGVASVNVHGRSDPPRGVLGLLASLMEHSCSPSASADVGSAAEGSVVTLRTTRVVRTGEALSIAYVARDAPVDERRRQLRLQHGFVCACERCVAELAAAGGERESESWRRAWEDRTWCGVDPYTGESMCCG